MIVFPLLGLVARQWQVIAIGQAFGQAQRDWAQSSDLLSDGSNVGHSCRIPAVQALPLSSEHFFFLNNLKISHWF